MVRHVARLYVTGLLDEVQQEFRYRSSKQNALKDAHFVRDDENTDERMTVGGGE